MKPEMHPSGMTLERWNWPFKTPDERKKVATYYKRNHRAEKQKLMKELNKEEALL